MSDFLFEFRSYRLRPGMALRYLQLLQSGGVAVVSRHLPLLGFWMTETGRLNVLHHLWAYEDLNERAACRARLMADPDWTEGFIPEGFPLLEAQESRLLRLVAGSPALDAALAERQMPVVAGMFPAPVTEDTLHGLTLGSSRIGAEAPALIGDFTTISGEAPGGRVVLSVLPGGIGAEAPGNVTMHELLRPASFSPLR